MKPVRLLAASALLLSALPAAAQSNGALVLAPSGTLYAVNSDSNSVTAVDPQTRRKLGETAVGKDPRSLALSPDGKSLYVTSQADARLTVLDASALSVLASIPVDAEPYGVVASPVGDFVYVASSAAAAIDVVRVADFQIDARIAVGPRPMGLALSSDGARLYVTHFLTGNVSVIDTTTRTVTSVIPTGPDSNMSQRIVINAATGKAYLPHIRSNTGNPYLLFDGTVFPELSVIDLAGGESLPRERSDLSIGLHSVNLPFDVVLSPDNKRAYVANLGSGELSVVDLALRYRVADIDVGDGPRGVALSPDGGVAYVLNSLSDDISVVDLAALRETARIPITTSPLDPVVKRGKTFFFSSRSNQISRQRWMSCATCHIEADMDGRSWQLAGIGPRNTPSIRGALATPPLHWDSDACGVQDVAEFTIRAIQGGSGLISGQPATPCVGTNVGRSADLDALVAFCASLPARKNPLPQDAAAVARGQAIFNRGDVACNTCHVPPLYTNSTLTKPFLKHDVGTASSADVLGPAFDTPSLLMLWNTAPYLHDGSAPTLMDVLTTRNQQDRHGRTSTLTDAEKADLIAFLLSL
jgi:YVTN family beta-propeller protein